MIEFAKSENLKKLIAEEQEKLQVPYGYAGEFNLKRLQENRDLITDCIEATARKIRDQNELYLICEMAKNWVDSQPGEVVWQGMIPLNPRTKKNNQKIIQNRKTKAPMVVQNDRYRQYEKDAGWFIHSPRMKPIDFPVNIKYTFYRENQIRCDGLNLSAAMDDILVKYGIIADDNFKVVAGHDGTRVFVDKENPRTEIEITRMPNYNPIKGGKNNGQPTD